jgi:hypothetical protein
MPCYKCANGKWKYGQQGRCQFDTLKACKAAEAAIHARDPKKELPAQDVKCSCNNSCKQEPIPR